MYDLWSWKRELERKKKIWEENGRVGILAVPFWWWGPGGHLIFIIKWISAPKKFLGQWIEIGILTSRGGKKKSSVEWKQFITRMSMSPIEQDHESCVYRTCVFKEISSENSEMKMLSKWKGKTNRKVTSCLGPFFPAAPPSCLSLTVLLGSLPQKWCSALHSWLRTWMTPFSTSSRVSRNIC